MLKRQTIKPPDRGSFPLDHFSECSAEYNAYMKCLEIENKDANKCRIESGKYLLCRMENNLLANEPLEDLGFKPDEITKIKDKNYQRVYNTTKREHNDTLSKEKQGFFAGVELIDNYSKAKSWVHNFVSKFKN